MNILRLSASWSAYAVGATLVVSCSDNRVVAPMADPRSVVASMAERFSVCHFSAGKSEIIHIPAPALAAHRGHGDYVTDLEVSKTLPVTAAPDSIHFFRITDAISAARETRVSHNETTTASCRINIAVGPGVFVGSVNPSSDATVESLPLVIDVPDVTVAGSLVMPMDELGRASGSDGDAATTLVARPGLISVTTGNPLDKKAEPMIIVNAHPDGSRGDGARIQGFVFQSGNDAVNAVVGGKAVLVMRAQGVVIQGNQAEAGFSEPFELRSASAYIGGNYVEGRGGSCAFCLFGPGDYDLADNRHVGPGGLPGILTMPANGTVPPGIEPQPLPTTALLTVSLTNNEIRNHQHSPGGVGLRIAAIGVAAPNVYGTSRIIAQDNDFSNNRFAVMVEAGFPVVNTGLRGDVDLTLLRNTLTSSCQNSVLVTTNTQGTALGLSTATTSLKNSTLTLLLNGNVLWDDIWYTNPAGVGNALVVDGQTIDYGSRIAYQPAKVCSTP